MGEIHKLTKEGVTLYPATTTDAVVHPRIRTELTNLITSYNVTALYPTSGSGNSSRYTLQSAISLLSSKLLDSQKVPGIKIVFCDIINHETQEWRYLGDTFTEPSCWSREDSWYVTVSEEASDIENLLVNDVLKKTRQSLTEEEKETVKDNLDLQLYAKTVYWGNNNINAYTNPGIYTLSGTRTKNSDNLPIQVDDVFSGVLIVTKGDVTVGQELIITTEAEINSYNRFYNTSTDTWSTWNLISKEINLGEIELDKLGELKKEGIYKAVIEDLPLSTTHKYVKIEVLKYNNEITQTLHLVDSSLLTRKCIDSVWTDFIRFITSEDLDKVQEEITELRKSIESLQLKTGDDYCAASWDPEDLSPECVEVHGNLEFCNQWEFYLIDTTDNEGEATKPVGKLMKNNLLRFEDGSWAPTVGITEERKAECDVALYLSDGTQYCSAGGFDPVKFYNKYGVTTKLFTASNKEVNILRPWETTQTKYTIGIGREKTIYFLDNVIGDSGYRWKGIFTKPVMWDGIDTSFYELKPTAISPCSSVVIRDTDGLDKTRNFFYLYNGVSSCVGHKGQNTECSLLYSNNRSYPASRDLIDTSGHKPTQINAMVWSRNNNLDPTSPVPFAEGGFFALNAYLTSYEIYHKTKYLHDENKFTGGICNYTIKNESGWKKYGGIRFRIQDSNNATWEYASWGQTLKSKNLYTRYYNSNSERESESISWSAAINNQGPKEACMESQMAGSYAKELGILENTEFDFYGNTFWYVNVPGTRGLENQLDIIVYKKMIGTMSVYSDTNELKILELEVILRTGLVNGVKLGGDTFTLYGGGYELVGTNKSDSNPNYEADKGGYPVKIYLEPDQNKWTYETETRLSTGTFGFEDIYPQLIEDQENIEGSGYCLERVPFTNFPTKRGGSSSNGECCNINSGNNWLYAKNQVGNRSRICNQVGSLSTSIPLGYRSGYIRNNTSVDSQINTVRTQVRLNNDSYPLS